MSGKEATRDFRRPECVHALVAAPGQTDAWLGNPPWRRCRGDRRSLWSGLSAIQQRLRESRPMAGFPRRSWPWRLVVAAGSPSPPLPGKPRAARSLNLENIVENWSIHSCSLFEPGVPRRRACPGRARQRWNPASVLGRHSRPRPQPRPRRTHGAPSDRRADRARILVWRGRAA